MKLRWLFVLVLLICAGCLLIPDDQETGTRVPNIRPLVRITAGAATPDSSGVDYKVNFQWRGADQDGMVIRFQYATDDTTTEAAWTDTTAFGALLRFRASQDQQSAQQTFNDWHTFYIRAIDNEYATSSIDKRYFNARTIAPLTRITFPRLASRPANLVRTFNVEWEGEDIDSSAPEKTPAEYEYKLIKLPSGFISDATVLDSLHLSSNVLLDTLRAGDKTRWIRVSGETKEFLLRDLPLTQSSEVFVFAVRAVDEAGAIEPDLDVGDNWIMFHVMDIRSQPYVTVSERTLGAHEFPNDGEVWYVEVPSDTPLRFKWTGDASHYGSKAGDVNYGLDVPDPQDDRYRDPRGIGGWIGWGKYTGVVSPLIFPSTESGQQHVFYIRMRDAGGLRSSERLCTVVMTVVAFTFSRPALLVDDAKVGYPGLTPISQDEIHDAFIEKFIGRTRDFTGGELDYRRMYTRRGPYSEGLNPTRDQALKLSELCLYSTVLWSFNFTVGETSGIWFHEHDRNSGGAREDKTMLSAYLAAGGKLFLFGGRPLSAIISTTQGIPGGDYPKLPPQAGVSEADFMETSFIWRFLHVRNMVVGVDPFDCTNSTPNEHQSWRDGLSRCVSQNPAYPDLYIDPVKHDMTVISACQIEPKPPTGGLRDYEGVLFDRRYSPFYPEAGLDTLYTSETYSWAGVAPSTWGGAVVAQRYESTPVDTLRGTAQGRIVLFLFQPYPFFEGPAVDAGTAAITWLFKGQDY